MRALRSGFRIILAETAERKTESFLFRRRRRNNPKKREVKGFEGWRFPQGNTTPYLDFSLAWYALPIERLFVPEVALRHCGGTEGRRTGVFLRQLLYLVPIRHAPRVPKCDPETGEVIEKKES